MSDTVQITPPSSWDEGEYLQQFKKTCTQCNIEKWSHYFFEGDTMCAACRWDERTKPKSATTCDKCGQPLSKRQ